MDKHLSDLLDAIHEPLRTAQVTISAAPNSPRKHLALLALGSIQLGRAAIRDVIDGGGSLGIGEVSTSAR